MKGSHGWVLHIETGLEVLNRGKSTNIERVFQDKGI